MYSRCSSERQEPCLKIVFERIYDFQGLAVCYWPAPDCTKCPGFCQLVKLSEICSGKSDNGTGFSPGNPIFLCQYYSTIVPHSYLSQAAFIKRTSGQSLETFKKTINFRKLGSIGLKSNLCPGLPSSGMLRKVDW